MVRVWQSCLEKKQTSVYSTKAANTKSRQATVHMSIAFMYETGGRSPLLLCLCVIIVKMVRLLSEMRAAVDSVGSQKESHEITTMRVLGK